MKTKVLLLGGEGFLGSGLKEELSERGIRFKSIDYDDMDLESSSCIEPLVSELEKTTHVVLLAAKIGRILFRLKPVESAFANKMIFDNVMKAIDAANTRYGRKYDFTFYSTSEIFGSVGKTDMITLQSKPRPLMLKTPRKAYANQKFMSEKYLKRILDSETLFSRLKIIRPFNVSGKHQRRGVVYDMIYDALKTHHMWYSTDTTRTITSADYAKRLSVDAIMSEERLVECNLSENITVSMETLAETIRDVIGDKTITLVKRPPDKEIRFRQTSMVDDTTTNQIGILKKCIADIIEEMDNDRQ